MNYLEIIEQLTETQGLLIERLKEVKHLVKVNDKAIEELQDEIFKIKNK